MIKSYTILNDTWEVNRKVGQGTFCHLYLGKNITGIYDDQDEEKSLVAVKVNGEVVESSILKWEASVLKDMSSSKYVPRLICYGSESVNNETSAEGKQAAFHSVDASKEYLVMEYLSGDDMSQLRNRIRAISGSGLVSLPAASFLALQMLFCIKDLHKKGYIHRDIKPANFVRRSKDSTEFCIIDFGIAKMVPKSKDLNVIANNYKQLPLLSVLYSFRTTVSRQRWKYSTMSRICRNARNDDLCFA